MKCARCQHENRLGAKFCEECAAPLARGCANCGAQLAPTAKFCSECAHPAGQAAPARFAAPDAYTPKYLAERILTSKAALEGERKQVSVLFADLKGSMELFADRDPEDARRLLDPVLERMMEAVHHYEGTVNQVMGDGIMALFGAPLTQEDHAVRACYAALRMQESVKRYAEEVHRTAGVPVHIRVGVNSGEVVVRSIGSDLRMDYTAVGQTTNVAARLEQMAMPGSILVSPETLKLAEGYVVVNALGARPVKGLDAPLDVFEVLSAGTVRSRLQVAAARGLTRFVGRVTEIEQLREALDRGSAGHGQVVAVVGEPGVGKSRLFWELIHSHRVHGWLVVQSASVSYGKASAYLPVIELLRGYFGIDSRNDPRKIKELVTGKVLTLAPALATAVPPLLALLDVPVDEVSWTALEPSQRQQRTLDAVKRLLLRESEVQPLIVVFEDLHWIDADTQALLDSLVESLPGARLLLLVNYRPEYRHAWGGKTYYRQLQIDSLPAESADELLAALLGPDAALGPLKRLLIERTEANPLFLEESVRALVETAALVGERAAYRLTRPVEQLTIPATVQAILAARIDRLSPEDKRLLQAASVIGKDVPFELLEAIGELPDTELRQGLARLQSAELLYEGRIFPDLEYTFKHALTFEVAYGSLLQERRRTLHARIAHAIEQLYPERVIEHAERLAYHALRGEEWSRAARYAHLAAGRAMAHARYEAAATLYETVIRAIDRQSEGGDPSLKLDAYLELFAARVETGAAEGFEELGEKAEALARALGDRERLAQVRVRLAQGSCFIWVGSDGLETALVRSREAFDLAAPTDLRTRSYARLLAGTASLALGRFRDAVRECEAGVGLFTTIPVDAETYRLVLPIRANLRAWQAAAYAALGEFEAALTSAAEARQIANEIDHPQCGWLAAAYSSHVLVSKGEIDAAARIYESGLAIAKDNQLPYGVLSTSLGLAHCRFLMGRDAEGMKSLPDDRSPGAILKQFTRTVGRYGALPASAYLTAGRLDKAQAEIAHGLALAMAEKARAYQVPLLRLRAEALAMPEIDDRDEAVSCWRQCLELAAELEMRPELAHAHLGLARLLRNTRALDQAREHLRVATSMYREMDMRFWLEQAETAMSELG